MPVPASSAPCGEGDLRLFRQRPEAHVRNEQRNLEAKRFGGRRADDELGTHRRVIEQRLGGHLRGHDLEVVPMGKDAAGHTH